MDLKKVIIAIIVLLIIVVGAYFVLNTPSTQVIKYDEHFNVSVPADFNTTETNGQVTSAFPENKSYVVTIVEENNSTVDSMESDFKIIKDAENLTGIKENFSDINSYNIGNNKVYEFTTIDEQVIKESGVNAKKLRVVSFVVPNSNKVYDLCFGSNDTSIDLHNSDIEAIINSTSQTQ